MDRSRFIFDVLWLLNLYGWHIAAVLGYATPEASSFAQVMTIGYVITRR